MEAVFARFVTESCSSLSYASGLHDRDPLDRNFPEALGISRGRPEWLFLSGALTAECENSDVSQVNAKTATIRRLRTDFRSVKRSIEQHGEVVITDHGQPACVSKVLPAPAKKRARPPDYFARVLKRQPKRLSEEATRDFWEAERRSEQIRFMLIPAPWRGRTFTRPVL